MITSTPAPTTWLGETLGFWIQTGALLASALGALWIVWSRAKSERRRATVDMLIERRRDKDLLAALRWIRLSTNDLVGYLKDRACQEYRMCMDVLNHYEFTAAAIRESAFDEELFKRMQCTMVILDWDALCPFVMELRRQDKLPTLFQEFEWLALRWQKNPLKLNRK